MACLRESEHKHAGRVAFRVARRARSGLPRCASGSLERSVAAFTLIELLVSVSIIGLLIAILIPALQQARAHARLTACLSNIRSQGTVIAMYAVDHAGALPPKFVWELRPGGIRTRLLNGFLADYSDEPFPLRQGEQYPTPQGIWRCPDVAPDDDDPQRWTHTAILHHAPNTWLFNTVWVSGPDNVRIVADAPTGWQERHGGDRWRIIDWIPRPGQIVSVMDNVNYFLEGHGHREARETIGSACDIVFQPRDPECDDNRGSHERIGRRPALFADSHGEALPSSSEYWRDTKARYRGPDEPHEETEFHHREVEHLLWFIAPEERINTDP